MHDLPHQYKAEKFWDGNWSPTQSISEQLALYSNSVIWCSRGFSHNRVAR